MLKDSKLESFMSYHSLRHSGTSRLLQGGVDKKIIREYTGHRSDVLNQYQATSEDQKRIVSDVSAGVKKDKKDCEPEFEMSISQKKVNGSDLMSCLCIKKKSGNSTTSQVADLIDVIMKCKRGGKVKIKLE